MLFDKLRQIEERSNEIARMLSDPAILAQPAEYARLRREHAETVETVERFTEYRKVLKRLGEARHILSEGGDRALGELARPRGPAGGRRGRPPRPARAARARGHRPPEGQGGAARARRTHVGTRGTAPQ